MPTCYWFSDNHTVLPTCITFFQYESRKKIPPSWCRLSQ